jgi:hypothetical protein
MCAKEGAFLCSREIPYSMLYAYSSKFQHKLQSCSVFGLVSGCQRVKFEIRTKFTTIARNEDRRGEGGGEKTDNET